MGKSLPFRNCFVRDTNILCSIIEFVEAINHSPYLGKFFNNACDYWLYLLDLINIDTIKWIDLKTYHIYILHLLLKLKKNPLLPSLIHQH